MKKIIAIILTMLLIATCLVSCSSDKNDGEDSPQTVSDNESKDTSNDNGDEEQPNPEPQSYKITASTEGVKVLGVRNLASEAGLHMDWSCSGVEFAIDLKGDSVRLNFNVSAQCLFRIWVDGEEYTENGEKYFTPLNGILQLTEIPEGKHTLRVMKVTGYTLARAELIGVTFAGELLTDVVDTSDKELYIEFVGDSITCGWGTIGANAGAYTDQDGTLAYSYLLAEELNADYSMTALSGQGLLCGTPGVTNGYLYADPIGNEEEKYDFARKADIVVINVGTNDFTQEVGESNFKTAYLNFLQTVREKNGDRCKILCLYNAMNDTYANAILEAVAEFGGKDEGVTAYSLTRVSGHPTASEHEAYAEILKGVIETLPEKFVSDFTIVEKGDGDMDNIDLGNASKG